MNHKLVVDSCMRGPRVTELLLARLEGGLRSTEQSHLYPDAIFIFQG